MSIVEIYTDGGCIGNPGPGGWAFVAISDGGEYSENGAVAQTTNNRMELTAVIRALEHVSARFGAGDRPELRMVTDSEYVRRGISEWIHNWIRNGWKTSDRKPVKNQDLWIRLHELRGRFTMSWNWVKGHSGNKYNEMCDSLVQEAIRRLSSGDAG